jgi:chromosome segregation ATPase
MAHSSEKNIAKTRFVIEDLQKRIAVLEATREDLERQVRKLNDSVPEDDVAPNAQKDGYVAYGSYAQSVIAKKTCVVRWVTLASKPVAWRLT